MPSGIPARGPAPGATGSEVGGAAGVTRIACGLGADSGPRSIDRGRTPQASLLRYLDQPEEWRRRGAPPLLFCTAIAEPAARARGPCLRWGLVVAHPVVSAPSLSESGEP